MKAAVLEAIGKPLRIMDLDVPSFGFGQLPVKMAVAGICGAQIQEIDGKKGDPAHCPHLLGHEGCGYAFGKKVVVHWRKGEGTESQLPIKFGKVKAGHCTTFSEWTVVSENRITPIPDDVPNDFAALLGCCLSTALALVENEANIKLNERVIVIGCGGLGLALILAARLKTIFVAGIDISEAKRDLVESLRAQFGNRVTDEVTADLVIDTVSNSKPAYAKRYISLQKGGSEGGGFNPTRDIPRYVQMWRDGKLNGWEKIITHKVPLDGINRGIALMRQGKAGRVMINFEDKGPGCSHIPRCFENSSDCWNWEEGHRRTERYPNFP